MKLTDQLKEENKELWTRFIDGDDNAFVRLYALNVDAMLNYGLHFTPLRDQVKDAIQDVFVTIYSKRERLGLVENVRLYLFVALKNKLFALFNKEMKHYQIDTVEPVFTLDSSAEDIYIINEQEDELKRCMQKMLDSLSHRQREVIYYRFTEGLSFDEICVLMKMNVQSVRNLLHRSITKIRALYIEHYNYLQVEKYYHKS